MNLKRITQLAFIAMLLTVACFGQVTLTSTTLSAAITANTRAFNVASATGIVAPNFGSANSAIGNQTVLYVDHEAMFVTGINGTYVTVTRGFNGTFSTAHISGATVYVGPPSYLSTYDRFGACTSTNELVLPVVNTMDGHVFTCATTGGQWAQIANGTMSANGSRIAAFCTGTVGSAETEYLNGAACSGATTATASTTVSQPGVIGNLRVTTSVAATGGSGKDVATVYKNGSATTITCTIAASATSCSDTTHFVTVAAGDRIQVQFVSASGDAAANISAGLGSY